MLSATPKKAQAAIRKKSFVAIFSFGPKKETIQNKIVAPATRNTINP